MRIRGYRRIRDLIDDHRARRFVDALDRADYVIPDEKLETLQRKLASILDENILPFWFPACIDLESGGYHCECTITGEWQPNRNKVLVSQARVL